MNEFDEIVAVRRLHDLLRERGAERTPAEIRRTLRKMSRAMQITYDAAVDYWERLLLSNNPNPEKWE